jgi:hypothetical protein
VELILGEHLRLVAIGGVAQRHRRHPSLRWRQREYALRLGR